MFNGENFITAKGVTLSREQSGENNLWVRLFLKDEGMVSLSSRNFKGDSEPFLWCIYKIQKKSRSTKYFVQDIEVKDDMLSLKRSITTLKTVLKWQKLLIRYLPHEQPDNELLTSLYFNMKLLSLSSIPDYVAGWRFLWQWLMLWGIAPDIVDFFQSRNFNNDEISLLIKTVNLTAAGVTKLFAEPMSTNIRENIFKIAAKLTPQRLIYII